MSYAGRGIIKRDAGKIAEFAAGQAGRGISSPSLVDSGFQIECPNMQLSVSVNSGLELREAVLPSYRSDTTLLFVHGMSHKANFFDEAMTHLALNDGIRCMSVSLEGHGDSPLREGRSSVNELSISDYKENVLSAIRLCAESGKNVVPVFHSLSGRCGYELLYEGLLPECVKGLVMLAPVPAQGAFISAIAATAGDTLRSGRLTPLAFGLDLVRGDIKHFMQSNPGMLSSVFFSGDPHGENRLLKGTPEAFSQSYLGAESRRAVVEILFASKTEARPAGIPVLIMASANDRVIRSHDILRMANYMKNNGTHGLTLKLYDQISHEMPMDIAMGRVMGDLRKWLAGFDC